MGVGKTMGDTGFMEYDPNLDFWDQPRLLRGLLSILGVSAVMIWVEVLFHRYVLLPEGNAAVKNRIRCAHKSFSKPVDEMTEAELKEAFGDDLAFFIGISGTVGTDKASLLGLYNLENIKLQKANTYAYLSMAIPFFVVILLMYRIYYKLKQDNYRHHFIPIFGGFAMEGVALSVLVSVVLFLCFQILFYFYGLNFNFASGLELATELREYADQELFQQYIPPLFRSGNSGANYQDLVKYESGPIELPSSWSRDQRLYPRAIDASVKNLDPFLSSVTAFFPKNMRYDTGGGYCEPWTSSGEAAEECQKYELEEYSALWQAEYQTKLSRGSYLNSLRTDYCTSKFWTNKYPEMRSDSYPDSTKLKEAGLILRAFNPAAWDEEQRARYKRSTKAVPATIW